MGMSNTLPSEVAAVVATIDPDVYTAATYLSDAIDMAKFDQILAVVMSGTLGASATIAAKLTQATTSGGTYKDITGKAITTLSQAVPPITRTIRRSSIAAPRNLISTTPIVG